MFWFNDRPGHHRHFRRNRGIYGFPWMFFAFFWIFPHGQWWLPFALGIGLFLLIGAMRSNNPQAKMRSQQPYQQPYYQPTSEPYKNEVPQQPYYQPYEQGYQHQESTAAVHSLDSQPSYQAPVAQMRDDTYQYDQPRAEYPQQMPPM